MVTLSPTDAPHQELVEENAAGNHPECAAPVLGSHKQPWTRHKTPSFLLALNATHFFPGDCNLCQETFFCAGEAWRTQQRPGSGYWYYGKAELCQGRGDGLFCVCATFAADSGFLHILGSNIHSLWKKPPILKAFYPYMGIIIFSFEGAVIWGENWQKYPTTYTWKITTWAFFFRHCHEGLVPGWLSGASDPWMTKAWSETKVMQLNTCSCFKLIFTCNSNSCFFQNKYYWLKRSLSFLYLCNIHFPLAHSPRY